MRSGKRVEKGFLKSRGQRRALRFAQAYVRPASALAAAGRARARGLSYEAVARPQTVITVRRRTRLLSPLSLPPFRPTPRTRRAAGEGPRRRERSAASAPRRVQFLRGPLVGRRLLVVAAPSASACWRASCSSVAATRKARLVRVALAARRALRCRQHRPPPPAISPLRQRAAANLDDY